MYIFVVKSTLGEFWSAILTPGLLSRLGIYIDNSRFQLVYQETSVSLTRPIHDSWKPSEVYIFALRRENSNRSNPPHLSFCPNAAKERGRVYSWTYPNESQLRYISPCIFSVSFVVISSREDNRPEQGKECAQSGSIHSMTSTGQVTSDFISSSTSTSIECV